MKVIDIIKKNNLLTKKSLGQNFLIDEVLLDKIANVAKIDKNSNILEVGSGPGGLTYSILKQNPEKLVSIELDDRCFNILKEEFHSYKNFRIINSDALNIDESLYFDKKIKVIANLPYNIGTALILKWLNSIDLFEDFTLLLQKEVVERIVAKPGNKDYGRLSVIVQAFCEAKKVFDIKPTSFLPPPKVMSSVIYIKSREARDINSINIKKLEYITFSLFNQRRKKIKQSILKLMYDGKIDEDVLNLFDMDKRAEELEVYEFILLSNKLK
ncbi:MAG: 16S rRNA (adenine(1518)-N(6)/adenine(1519)-N(6))-dimethyltransferase RsmA [Crenarchaeota archaeon]|nr:16S rRNA (adenine(1518)-N(6)/adenine(1519)-N(6))-dimethyltransferase RsmA [Thermoproteota archaeon]